MFSKLKFRNNYKSHDITFAQLYIFSSTMSLRHIPTVYATEDTFTRPFIQLVEQCESIYADIGAVLLMKSRTLGFTLNDNVLDMTIKYRTQKRTALGPDVYEIQVSPGPKQKCTVREWIERERNEYFQDKSSAKKFASKFWQDLMPNGKFDNINYSNGNKFSLFPGMSLYKFKIFVKLIILTFQFSDTTDIFNVKNLHSPISEHFATMKGLTQPFLIVSSSGAVFPWHIEEQVNITSFKL